MATRVPFVTLAEIQTRHPRELAMVAADETTRAVDPARVEAGILDASTEIRAILGSRYSADELDRLDAESAGVLRLYAIDIAMYRISLSFGRGSEAIQERYAAAVKRLDMIAGGRGGALTVLPGAGGLPADPTLPAGPGSPNEVLIDVPERIFTRRRFGFPS